MIGQDVQIVSMLNFLEPMERTIEVLPWSHGMRIEDCAPEAMPLVEGLDLAVSVNGRVLTDFERACYTVQPGDSLLFKVVPRGGGGGGGKNPIAAIASIAMMVVAPVIAPHIGLAMFNAGFAGSIGAALTMGKIVAGGLAMGGAMLVNSVLPASQPQPNTPAFGSNAYEHSATYAWTPQENPTQNGHPVPIIYGTVANVVPFKLCQYISTDGDNQYLNMLFALAEGELDASGVTDIEINGNPIVNYDNVTTDFRPGTFDQLVIEHFNDTVYERSIGTKLSTDWTTVQCDGTAVEAMGVGLSCPSGLWYANDQGGLDSVSIAVEAEYRAVGDQSWTSWATWTISAAQRSAVRRYNRLDNLTADQFEVRLRFVSAPDTGSRYATDCYFEYLHEINLDDFRLPHTALLAVRALATDQLSGGAPRVTCTLSRPTVDIYDPDSGTWGEEDAGNPAWAAYDLCCHGRYGAGVDVDDIVYDEFEAAADWCVTKSITGGMIFDSSQDLKTACDSLGLFGRFKVVPRGTSVGVVSDKPVDLPDQGLVVGDVNMIDFGLSWEDDERADAVEVTYFDPDKGRDTVLVLGDHYHGITTRQPRHAKLTLYPCQDRALAIKAGRYLLRCNRYLAENAEIKMREEAMGLLPGSVVQLAHSIVTGSQPARILSATTTTIILDREVTLFAAESYSFRVTHSDRQHTSTGDELIEKRNIAAVAEDTTTDTITLALALDYAPVVDCVCSIDDTTVTTQYYRIGAIRRTQKGRYTVEALEYHEEIYADEGEVPEITTADTVSGVAGLSAGIFYRTGDGSVTRVVGLSWRGSAFDWRVWAKRADSDEWSMLGDTVSSKFDCTNLQVGVVYDFAVSASASLIDAETIQFDFTPPPPPDLSAVYRQGDRIYWTYNDEPIDLKGFRVRVSSGDNRNWEKGMDFPLEKYVTTDRSLDIAGLGASVVTVMVRPVNTTGEMSDSASFVVLNLGEHAPENLIYTDDIRADGFPDMTTSGHVDGSGDLVADDTGESYLPDGHSDYLPQPQAAYLPSNYKAMVYEFSRTLGVTESPGILYLSSEISGDGWAIEYRRRGDVAKYLEQDDGAYLPDESAAYLGGSTPWANMPGDGIDIGHELVDFRISFDAGSRQGVISSLSVNVDVPDVTESFEDMVISSAGTRLPITKKYRSIDHIGSITIQDDGLGATGVRIIDKDPSLGPMLEAVGASQATIDIFNMKGH